MRRSYRWMGCTALVLVMLPAGQAAATIVGSKHDMSSGGGQTVRSVTENEICVFCHTPHNASPSVPLWNRQMSTATYTPYTSSALNVTPGQPTGASKLCLSCHDGTIALGNVLNKTTDVSMTYKTMADIPGPQAGYIGIDLSDDHPISFKPQDSIDAGDTSIQLPGGTDAVKLDANGEMQCTSCHDAHEPGTGTSSPFLVMDDVDTGVGGQICLICHSVSGWALSVHEGDGTDYTRGSDTRTVAEWGCRICHDPHTADIHPTMLDEDTSADPDKWEDEEVCYNCHKSGGAASADIETEIGKSANHPLADYPNLLGSDADIHDVMEGRSPGTEHVECVDCHSPHQARSGTHSAPGNSASNVLEGVTGVSANYGSVGAWASPSFGTASPVTYEYEVCFRCHSTDSSMFAGLAKGRVDIQFNPDNRSHHAVIEQGENQSGSIANNYVIPFMPSSTVYCSDCHGSNSTTGPAGPHGSTNSYIMAGSSESTTNVCFKCHKASIYRDGGAGSRVDHPLNTGHTDDDMSGSNQGNAWGIWCMNCHGGGEAGGIHGTNAGLGPDGGTSPLGDHFMNGAAITGFTEGSWASAKKDIVSIECWSKGTADSVTSCDQGHSGRSVDPNFNY